MYEIVPTKHFLKQVTSLNEETKKVLDNKIELLRVNPFRFKAIEGYRATLLRVRFSDRGKSKRLVYEVRGGSVILWAIFDRDKEYKDLHRYLAQRA